MTPVEPPPVPRDIARKKAARAVRFRTGKRLAKHTQPKPAPVDPEASGG